MSARAVADIDRKTLIFVEWKANYSCYGARRLHKHLPVDPFDDSDLEFTPAVPRPVEGAPNEFWLADITCGPAAHRGCRGGFLVGAMVSGGVAVLGLAAAFARISVRGAIADHTD